MLDLSAAKIGRQFYTDVEKFTNVIDKMYRYEYKKRLSMYRDFYYRIK